VTQVGHLLRSGAWTSCPTGQVAANLQLLGPRHEVPAGMIGWWQINCRGDIAPEQAVRLDAFYIENWSLAFDLYIVLKTISTVIERKGAY
jgi:lipopolysaccharide/colanic/teichoic acid biosynthesis glycosyltransferase